MKAERLRTIARAHIHMKRERYKFEYSKTAALGLMPNGVFPVEAIWPFHNPYVALKTKAFQLSGYSSFTIASVTATIAAVVVSLQCFRDLCPHFVSFTHQLGDSPPNFSFPCFLIASILHTLLQQARI